MLGKTNSCEELAWRYRDTRSGADDRIDQEKSPGTVAHRGFFVTAGYIRRTDPHFDSKPNLTKPPQIHSRSRVDA